MDPDSFDYIFYSYGLSMYGNMPLIEPQEWKEVKKVEDFAIVIDTSMSCSGDLVKKFLEEKIGFLDIYEIIAQSMERHTVIRNPDLEEILAVEDETYKWIESRW